MAAFGCLPAILHLYGTAEMELTGMHRLRHQPQCQCAEAGSPD